MLPELDSSSRPSQWWDRDHLDPAATVWKIATRLRDDQGYDRECDADDSLALYFGNLRNSVSSYTRALSYFDESPPGYNVVQACVDTMGAHTVRNKVRPFFLTERGDPSLKEKALGMQRAVEAVFHDVGMWDELGTEVCFDGGLFEAGGVKWTPDYANVRVLGERVFPWEFYVSEREAKKGRPRQGFHVQVVPRDSLLDFFKDDPEAQRAILEAKPAPGRSLDDDTAEPGEVADMILVVDAWHLPSGRVDRSKPEAWGYDKDGNDVDPPHDGRHKILIEGVVLFDEPWPYDYFPIAWFKPRKKPIGYWSRSAAETLAGAQLALNRMNTRVDGIMHLHSRPLLYCWRKARVNTGKVTNAWANIIEGDTAAGQALQYITPQSVPAEYLSRIREIIAWAEKQFGLSEMAISAQKPQGVDHAPGMQHLADEQSIRHTPAFRAWERLFVDSARMTVDCLRMLAEYVKQWNKDPKNKDDQKTLDLLWGDSKQLKRIEWDKVDLDESQYHLKVWPTNLLPQTPAARASRVIEFLKEGLFTREQAMAALEFPDIEALMGDSAAAEQNIQTKLENIVRGDDYETNMPHPYVNFAMAKAIAVEKINRLEADGSKPEVIDRVIQFWEDCDELEKLAMPVSAPVPPGMPPPGPPGGVPMGVANNVPAGPLPGMPQAA